MEFILKVLVVYLSGCIVGLFCSCALFGYKLEIKDGTLEFEWGLQYYLKKRRNDQ